ncbi:hypothetical protein Dimus_034054 [Dionaea muscipula]
MHFRLLFHLVYLQPVPVSAPVEGLLPLEDFCRFKRCLFSVSVQRPLRSGAGQLVLVAAPVTSLYWLVTTNHKETSTCQAPVVEVVEINNCSTVCRAGNDSRTLQCVLRA